MNYLILFIFNITRNNEQSVANIDNVVFGFLCCSISTDLGIMVWPDKITDALYKYCTMTCHTDVISQHRAGF